MGKGICSVCDESYELSEDGLLLSHLDDRHGKTCTGVGHPPVAPLQTEAQKPEITAYGFLYADSGNHGFERW
jgi:hypothetical protein